MPVASARRRADLDLTPLAGRYVLAGTAGLENPLARLRGFAGSGQRKWLKSREGTWQGLHYIAVAEAAV
jgi:hypothetical protein